MAQKTHGHMGPAKRTVAAPMPVQKILTGKKERSLSSRKKGRHQVPRIPAKLRNVQKTKSEVIAYVLDTNVIMDAWDAIFRFHEHDVYLLSQVMDELNNHKTGRSDQAYNVRKAVRHIAALVDANKGQDLSQGIPLVPPAEIVNGRPHTGKLFFDFSMPKAPESGDIDLSTDRPDDKILMVCLALKAKGKHVVLITNDGGLRIKAIAVGIEAEEYLSEAITSAVAEEDVVTGFHHMPSGMWTEFGDLKVIQKGGQSEYTLTHPFFKNVSVNQFLFFPEENLSLRVMKKTGNNQVAATTLRPLSKDDTFEVKPFDCPQLYAQTLLADPNVVGVSLAGLAGSGKTYLALAAALAQYGRYRRIIVTRSPFGADQELGFLPGDEKEKMDPWMGGVYDNLEALVCKPNSTAAERMEAVKKAMEKHGIQIRSMNFMKGRSLRDTFIIFDEAQDGTSKLFKMMATRVGPGSKIVFLGNVAQIDNPFVTDFTNGLSVFNRAFASSSLAGHITLQSGQRSAFATEAEERL